MIHILILLAISFLFHGVGLYLYAHREKLKEDIEELDIAIEEFKKAISPPFMKILDWLENVLQKFNKK